MVNKKKVVIQNKRRGKAFQTKVAKMTGGRNIGTLGGEDVEHSIYSIEAKHFKTYRGESIMEQCEANCPKDKIPIAIVHLNGKRHGKDIVHMRFEDWEKLANKSTLKKRSL